MLYAFYEINGNVHFTKEHNHNYTPGSVGKCTIFLSFIISVIRLSVLGCIDRAAN